MTAAAPRRTAGRIGAIGSGTAGARQCRTLRVHCEQRHGTRCSVTSSATGSCSPRRPDGGRIPVLGSRCRRAIEATAARRRHSGPRAAAMSTHVVMTPGDVRRGWFRESAPHRADLSPVYNAYRVIPGRDADDNDRQALLAPVFMLSFLLDALLAEQERSRTSWATGYDSTSARGSPTGFGTWRAISRPPPTSTMSCWITAPASTSALRLPLMSSTCQ